MWARVFRLVSLSAVALIACTAAAYAQPDQAPPALPEPQQIAPPGQPAPSPGLPTPQETFSAIGRFFGQSIDNVGAGVKGAGEVLGGATGAAGEVAKGVGNAAGAVARLPLSATVTGWEPCPAAPNTAPDCVAASVALCRAKGYRDGRSLDITSAYKCPAVVWLERRQPNDTECANESFVSKAICQ